MIFFVASAWLLKLNQTELVQACQAMLRAALRHVNMTDSGKLMGFCPLYVGMSVKVTQKLLPPDVVQEATGEVLEIGFHEEERFAMPRATQSPVQCPHASHACWKRGWAKLDMLPRWVEVRLHGSNVDFTGTRRPGVFVMEPTNADWDFRCQGTRVINHPNNPKPVVQKARKTVISMRSTQLPVAPAGVGTFNNLQGKTAKDEVGAPCGHCIDLKLLDQNADSWAHYYMILGRATSLSTTLLLNFPTVAGSDEYDWSLFEQGPPEHVQHVFAALESRYRQTRRRVAESQAALQIFPAFDALPELRRGAAGLYEYNPGDWHDAVQARPSKRKSDAVSQALRERLERRAMEPARRRQR